MTDVKPERTEEETIAWFETDVLPRVISEGRLPIPGADPKHLVVKKLQYEGTDRGTDHFASLPYFLHLVLQDSTDTARTEEFRLVVKFINQKVSVRQAMETDTQFHNEMVFYNTVYPMFESFLAHRPNLPVDFLSDICPACRYAHIYLDAPECGIVIMDDLRCDGYATATSKVELDLEHCLISMKKIAKFHAISFAMKIEQPDKLAELSKLFVECRYQDERYKEQLQNLFYSKTASRAIDYLLSKGDQAQVPSSYLTLIKEKVTSDPYRMMRHFVEPRDPLSVICHGDFCRNNILYKLDKGKAIECRIFDYQTWRYSSPAVDLSFFIYMNTTQQLREDHFDELMDHYHSNFVNSVVLITGKTVADVEKLFPRDKLKEEFGELSLYGYLICSFFLGLMMAPKENAGNFEEEWETMTFEEMAEENVKQGGEVVSQRIAEIIVHMYKSKFYR